MNPATGLLKVRGEARRSDQVAILLAVKSLHEICAFICEAQDRMNVHFGVVDNSYSNFSKSPKSSQRRKASRSSGRIESNHSSGRIATNRSSG